MRCLTLLCLCLAVPALAQDVPSLGRSSVSAVTSQYVMNTLSRVPGTDKPLPPDGKWSISTTRPEICPHDDTPCARVIYTVPGVNVACEWTVIPQQGSAPAVFLGQNEDASRYLLRKLPQGDLTSLILTSPEPIYGAIARAAHVSGSVVVRISVSSDGTVTSATPLSGPAMLRFSTVDAAKRWSFRALQIGTQAAPFVVDLTANFSIQAHGSDGGLPKGTVSMRP